MRSRAALGLLRQSKSVWHDEGPKQRLALLGGKLWRVTDVTVRLELTSIEDEVPLVTVITGSKYDRAFDNSTIFRLIPEENES